jgi:hypothetical protein
VPLAAGAFNEVGRPGRIHRQPPRRASRDRGRIFGFEINYMGFSLCRECTGASEYVHDAYAWPWGYLHYIERHNVRPPEDFVHFIRAIAR